ncbi:MAG: histidinol-phosphate transaminase [Tannerellaceae bacterium]|nr:histidinol-phosphate transaminase [Tannerellaceae bacterium]
MTEIESLLRPNVVRMKPYSSARDEFSGMALVYLDANENPYPVDYSRYPDPAHTALRGKIAGLKGLHPSQIFTGNGSDEAIDLLIRLFCEPGIDNLIALSPSYGMYGVAADVNNVECRRVMLRASDFDFTADSLIEASDSLTKLIFLCSPNNPTGNLLSRAEIVALLDRFAGIVVVDEAYLDFAASPSFAGLIYKYPRLVVMQTLSKAWGAAGIRLGMAFAHPDVIAAMQKIKYSYNVNSPTLELALARLDREDEMKRQVEEILAERRRLADRLERLPVVVKVYPSDANFLLVKVADANAVYDGLLRKGVVVRNRHGLDLCDNCLRITVGVPKENDLLLEALNRITGL